MFAGQFVYPLARADGFKLANCTVVSCADDMFLFFAFEFGQRTSLEDTLLLLENLGFLDFQESVQLNGEQSEKVHRRQSVPIHGGGDA